jgi:hypothetical protein
MQNLKKLSPQNTNTDFQNVNLRDVTREENDEVHNFLCLLKNAEQSFSNHTFRHHETLKSTEYTQHQHVYGNEM